MWPAHDAWLTRIHISYTIVIVHISLFLELANMYDKLPYLTASISFISSVWDYVPHGFYFAGDVAAWRASDLLTNGSDRVDPSPRDHQISTCLIYRVSEAIGWFT